MSSLSETIEYLASMTALPGDFGQPYGPDRLAELHDFGSNPGHLRGYSYIPAELAEPRTLVVVLHGCKQNAAGYDNGSGWSEMADRHGFALLYPEQQTHNNGLRCFNWFAPGDTRRDEGEALSIRQMIDTMIEAEGIDPARIFITGLSAGGAMTSAMLATYPELFAAGAIIAGLPYGSARNVLEALSTMRGLSVPDRETLAHVVRDAAHHDGPWPRLSIWQGSADDTVAPSNAEAILAQWQDLNGLAAEPTCTERGGTHERRVWRDRDGRDLIEAHTITGMGHGTPLAPDTVAGGVAGPYMLDVGIASTARICAFWGIADAVDVPLAQADPATTPRPLPSLPIPRTADRRPTVRSAEPAGGGISRIIENALRASGLMR